MITLGTVVSPVRGKLGLCNRILLLLSSLLLASCALGPDYSRPPIDPSDRFRMAEMEGQSIANLPWWELLRDEQLQRLIEHALVQNKDLKQAVASVEELQARLGIARWDFMPKFDISGNAPVFGRHGGLPLPGFPTPFNYFGQTTLNWELDLWGRVRRANEAARADLLAREENRRAVVLTLVSSVAQSYFDLLQFDVQMDVARNALVSWEESVALAKAQLQGGIISRIDLDQFEAERARAASRVAELQRNIVQKENEMSVLLGNNPVTITRGASLTEQTLPPEVPAGLPSELLERRPDILQAEKTLAAATARIGMTKAARFPKLTVTGILGVASPALSNLLVFPCPVRGWRARACRAAAQCAKSGLGTGRFRGSGETGGGTIRAINPCCAQGGGGCPGGCAHGI